jgi:hypothetical protein
MEIQTMAEVSETVEKVDVKGEFRVCPACGYERGFHVSFLREGDSEDVAVVLICPGCGVRYDVGLTLGVD